MDEKERYLTHWGYTPDTPEAEVAWEQKLNMTYGAATHHVMPDIQAYQSMVTGEMIQSRSVHREHLRRHNVIEIGNEDKYLKPKPKETAPGLKQRIAEISAEKLRYR